MLAAARDAGVKRFVYAASSSPMAEPVATSATSTTCGINLLAATSDNPEAANQVYNAAVGDRITLNRLYEQLNFNLLPSYPHLKGAQPVYRDFRAGDVRHSLADIGGQLRCWATGLLTG